MFTIHLSFGVFGFGFDKEPPPRLRLGWISLSSSQGSLLDKMRHASVAMLAMRNELDATEAEVLDLRDKIDRIEQAGNDAVDLLLTKIEDAA